VKPRVSEEQMMLVMNSMVFEEEEAFVGHQMEEVVTVVQARPVKGPAVRSFRPMTLKHEATQGGRHKDR
jgi:hypothetical protein